MSVSNGYEAFGSFHTPSTASLFAQYDSESESPLVFQSDVASQRLQLENNSKSSSQNRSLFALDLEKWIYLNHGAFGAPSKVAIEAANHWRAHADVQPLNFNDRELFPLVVRSIKALSEFIGVSKPEQLVLLPNATAGLHSVLSSVLEEEGEDKTVVLFSTRYGAVRKMLQAIQDKQRSVHIHEEPLSLEESYDDQKVMEKLEKALATVQASGRSVSLVVVDHITSNTAMAMPVKEIVQHCHSQDNAIPVLVDGAHGLLNLSLDLDDIGADYYVGNCHKWFCSTRGAAFLHVARENGPAIAPRVISHGFFDGMQSAFMWTGLQDYSSWLALPQCLAFWRRQGINQTREYMHTLVQEAAELLYARWGMSDHLSKEREFPVHKRHAMRLVQLPTSQKLCGGVVVDEMDPKATSTDAKRVQDALHYVHRIEVPVKCVDSRLYLRLSAHVYNCLQDYEKLADTMTLN
ncbi:putative L-cysteine desulfhydrase 1 [Phytophthora citrophthora]|uniref:L-cysteine desulfhydrase 1 n=1 Tax=Phytophthora citrophthora TaxID=4793 RepID=A0AAD9G233_9STRA|nr:putative L-cysteine desulfhydrase 1 [Phytophthora citrophthora]